MSPTSSFEVFDHTSITIEDATIIADSIAEENKQNPHMLQDPAETIHACVQKYGWAVARTLNGSLAGFIKLSLLDEEMNIYERGSLFVLPAYRLNGIGRLLIESVTEKYRARSMLSVTNVPSVIRINARHEEHKELPRDEIPHPLLSAIEGPQALLLNDRVFVNNTLYTRILAGELS